MGLTNLSLEHRVECVNAFLKAVTASHWLSTVAYCEACNLSYAILKDEEYKLSTSCQLWTGIIVSKPRVWESIRSWAKVSDKSREKIEGLLKNSFLHPNYYGYSK
jgi:hypothetical protein